MTEKRPGPTASGVPGDARTGHPWAAPAAQGPVPEETQQADEAARNGPSYFSGLTCHFFSVVVLFVFLTRRKSPRKMSLAILVRRKTVRKKSKLHSRRLCSGRT